jgi:hypothetical protein
VALVLVATVAFAAPKKRPKPSARPAAASPKQAIVVDAPPAMAKLLQSTLGARFAVTVNREALSDQPLAKEVRSITAPVKAIAVVMARAAGDSWSLTVLNGADGTPLENQVFRAAARKPLKELPKAVAGAIALACATGQAPGAEKPPPVADPPKAEPTPKPEPKPEPRAEVKKAEPAPKKVEPAKVEPTPEPEPSTVSSSSDTPSTPSSLPALRMGLGFRGFGRSLSWAGDPEQALARYALAFAPAVALNATWYPAAHFTSGIVSNIGLSFVGDVGVGISSKQDTSRYGTRADRFRISGAFRQPFGSVFSLEAVAGVALQRYSIDPVAANDGTPRPNIPSVSYVGPRAGVGVRLAKLGPIEVDAMGGFVILTSTGELGTEAYFRRAGGFGVDAGAGVALQLLDNLQLRASLDWTRYFLSLRPEEGARFVAPSASDQYVGGSVALQWVM